jgi:hypothetical protein
VKLGSGVDHFSKSAKSIIGINAKYQLIKRNKETNYSITKCTMKIEKKIFVIGGIKAAGVYASLKKKFDNVHFFRNEQECRNSIIHFRNEQERCNSAHVNPNILIFDESIKDNRAISSSSSSTNLSNASILYLFNDQHFNFILDLIREPTKKR